MPRLAIVVIFVPAFFVTEAIKFSAEMEKACGEQLLQTLAKESDEEMKTIMNKLIENVQKGDVQTSQAIIHSLTESQRVYAMEKYWVDACGPMRSCLECPVEL